MSCHVVLEFNFATPPFPVILRASMCYAHPSASKTDRDFLHESFRRSKMWVYVFADLISKSTWHDFQFFCIARKKSCCGNFSCMLHNNNKNNSHSVTQLPPRITMRNEWEEGAEWINEWISEWVNEEQEEEVSQHPATTTSAL